MRDNEAPSPFIEKRNGPRTLSAENVLIIRHIYYDDFARSGCPCRFVRCIFTLHAGAANRDILNSRVHVRLRRTHRQIH